ncbi:coadhesin-like [Mya arenaria]|uniref:coadhesin-like n=1 Tax=Mya arenaria TaxID=6604 RepID=UPI0022E4EAC9|nr:coadhesin-like [Mya arenaria]
MMRKASFILLLIQIGITGGDQCTDLDAVGCANNPNLCADPILAKEVCAKSCNLCPGGQTSTIAPSTTTSRTTATTKLPSTTKLHTTSTTTSSSTTAATTSKASTTTTTQPTTRVIPVDGAWGRWGSWDACSVSCGKGNNSRSRKCNSPAPMHGGIDCSGSSTGHRECHMGSCPVDGAWGQWNSWDACSVSCGKGQNSRSRKCSSPAPIHGGSDCSGSSTGHKECNMGNCPVDGAWGHWSSWDSCSVSCGIGQNGRSRKCDSPAPMYGGTDCFGSASGHRECNLRNCPVDGAWEPWSSWEACSVSCGKGQTARHRNCNSPSPFYGGKDCSGSSIGHGECDMGSCPVDGAWGHWSSWDACSVSCGRGQNGRSRKCDSPAPAYGGSNCLGSSRAHRECNMGSCPVDGGWSEWTLFGACSRSCGQGAVRERYRQCNNPVSAFGGADCSGEHFQIDICPVQDCLGKYPLSFPDRHKPCTGLPRQVSAAISR